MHFLKDGAPYTGYKASATAGAVAVAALIALLAGCGGGSETSSTTATEAASSTTSTTTTTSEPPSAGSTTSNSEFPAALGSRAAMLKAVTAVLAPRNPADACGRYVTPRYLHVAYGGREGCIRAAQAQGSGADSIASMKVVNRGTQSTLVDVVAVPSGGPYDGSKVSATLIFHDDRYRVDRLKAHVPVGP